MQESGRTTLTHPAPFPSSSPFDYLQRSTWQEEHPVGAKYSALNLTYLSSLGPPISLWGRGWKLLVTLLKVKLQLAQQLGFIPSFFSPTGTFKPDPWTRVAPGGLHGKQSYGTGTPAQPLLLPEEPPELRPLPPSPWPLTPVDLFVFRTVCPPLLPGFSSCSH